MATSAVSTTGLVTVDPGTTYSGFGQLVILILIQLGGLGYMTVSSFIIMAANRKLSESRMTILKSAFSLPKTIGITHLVRNIFLFTLICELLGTLILYFCFKGSDIHNPLWAAVFHSVSAFCTAGFSLFATSFEAYKGNMAINLTLAGLAYAGGIGFIVFTDLWSKLKDRNRHLTFTTQMILMVTFLTALLGTVTFFVFEPSIQNLSTGERAMVAFFQTMTASTTVGFNTVPIGGLFPPVVILLYFLMLFGASPAGTGGGLKSTTLTALIAETWSHLRGYKSTSIMGREIPGHRIRAASMATTTYGLVLGLGIFLLSTAMPTANFEWLVFEAISAIGTVGLSMGLTVELNAFAKWVIIGLMYIGRLGVATFGLSFVAPKLFHKTKKDDLAI